MHDALDLMAVLPHGDRGIKARSNIAASQELIRVPLSLCLHAGDTPRSHGVRRTVWFDVLTLETRLLLVQ